MSTNETVLQIVDALTREACEAARAEGTQLDAEERAAFNRDLFRTAGGKASMLQDIEAGRRTEIDTINGAAVRLADKHGLVLPLNRAVYALVKGREAAMETVSTAQRNP
jgi:2-dehydropantoate 2-reductase